MSERHGAVKFKGNPMTLVGNEIKAGDEAPDFTLTANDMSEKTLSDYRGKTIIISVVPSLDTPTCDLQGKRFNQEAAELGDGVQVLVVSKDLPFAQKRWCGANKAENITTLSDYKHNNFGQQYGVLIQELGLLSRSVFIVDKDGKVQYAQVVEEVSQEPNYDEVLEEVRAVA